MKELRSARTKSGFTCQELANLLNVSAATISRWENGKREPKYDKLLALAAALHVTPNDLLGVVQKENPDIAS